MADSWQAKSDGTLEMAGAPPHPDVATREQLLNSALGAGGWSATVLRKPVAGSQFVKFESNISKGTAKFSLNIFLFPNLNWANRDRHEKRIQITQPYSEHQTEFLLDNSGQDRCLLLGVYVRDGCVVFCAWDSRSYRDHANPTSCYVKVDAIAKAMRDGFAQSVDTKNRLVCCFRPEFFHFYINNMNELHDRVFVTDLPVSVAQDSPPDDPSGLDKLTQNDIHPDIPRNRVVYGAPGTGKSHQVNQEILQFFPDSALRNRVTFYPDFTHSDFFGAYMPVPMYKESKKSFVDTNKTTPLSNHEPVIDYRFSPGPFMETLTHALLFPDLNFVLVIEELNRADAPAVFGDLFQLLDRDAASGESKFPINLTKPARDHLASCGINASDLQIPGNLYIWCTLNSADQGVMPLDAAFKRRWSFEYLSLNQNENVTKDWKIYLHFLGKEILWNDFRKALNQMLSKAGIQEDRLIGPFFMSQSELLSNDSFKNKLLMYLREDVLRHEPELIFKQIRSLGELIEAYDDGENIFIDSLSFS